MVTAPEAAVLLTLAATFDNRKPDPHAARAWAEALEHIDFTDAQAAITAHFQKTRDWIMPVDVINGVKKMEAERVAAAPSVHELEPPETVTCLDGEAFDRAYLEWVQETARRIRRGLPIETGERAPAVDDPNRLKELVAAVQVAHKAS